MSRKKEKEPIKPTLNNGVVMRRFCSECEKPNVYTKGMCQACYSKMHRNTDKGRERMRAYNLTAGKEAQRRFRERNKALKPPKQPKQNCKCGKPSIAKNMCMACYQRKKYVKKEGSIRNTRDGNKIFNDVLLYVKKGLTILNACKKAGFKSSSTLYRLITPLQKAELNAYKILRDVDEDEF